MYTVSSYRHYHHEKHQRHMKKIVIMKIVILIMMPLSPKHTIFVMSGLRYQGIRFFCFISTSSSYFFIVLCNRTAEKSSIGYGNGSCKFIVVFRTAAGTGTETTDYEAVDETAAKRDHNANANNMSCWQQEDLYLIFRFAAATHTNADAQYKQTYPARNKYNQQRPAHLERLLQSTFHLFNCLVIRQVHLRQDFTPRRRHRCI